MKKTGLLITLTLLLSFSTDIKALNNSAGDINTDGITDLKDIICMNDFMLGISDCDDGFISRADINTDGKTDVLDLILLKNIMIQEPFNTNKIYVSTSEDLQQAMKNASPGDEIILKPGVYESEKSGTKASLFMSASDGTKENPILIRSEDPENPAVMKGTDPSAKIVLYITGDYWRISDLKISTAQKGIVLDNSCHSSIENCEVSDIGSEGIHIRDDSCENTVKNCYVHDTGIISPKYGEAVYIGSAKSTTGYGFSCNNNLVTGCRLGPGVAAEHVDIKEYTAGNIIEQCYFDGTGISGENYADSFVDVKGNECIIRNNTGYRNKNTHITEAIQLHVQAEGWGVDNVFCDNTFYLDDESSYITKSWDGSATVYGNKRYPEGNMYDGDAIKVLS